MRRRILVGIFFLLTLRFLAVLLIPPGGDEVAQLYIADDIAQGVHFPVYFYQQDVMGTLESYFLAPFFRLFGFSFWGGRLYYSLFYFSFMGIYLWIVRRRFGPELTGYLFILLSILPFPALFFTTVIGWTEIPLLAILSLFLLLKMAEARDAGRKTSGPSLGLGMVCGIALWCNPLFILWLAPIGISLVWLIPPRGKARLLSIFFLGLLLGLLPVWLHGLQTGVFMSVKERGGLGFVREGSLLRVWYLFFARMKYFLSTFSFGSPSPWIDRSIRALSFIPLSIFLISFLSLLFHFLRSWRVQGPGEKVFYIFMIVPPLVFAALYGSRDFTGKDEGMRFFLQLLIPYLFAAAWQLQRLKSNFLKKGLLALLGGVLFLGNLYSGSELFLKTSELRQLVRFLEKEGLRFGIADLGIAYPVNALSRHRVIATPLPHHAVSESIWKKVKAEGPRFLVLERENPQLRKELEGDPNLKEASVGPYDIFYGDSDYLKSILDVREPILG